MSETSSASAAVREAFSHANLAQLPDKELTAATMRSLLETFRDFSPAERTGVQAFIRKSIPGPTDASIGAYSHGEAVATYNLLRNSLSTGALVEFDQKLDQGGYPFRFPLAVVRSILHDRKPYPGFEDAHLGVSENIVDFSLCPEAEGLLYYAMNYRSANIITLGDEPFMLTKLHKDLGKSVALVMKSAGPFVEGVLYSPAESTETGIIPVRREINQDKFTVSFADVAKLWYLDRPIHGSVPPTQSPYIPQQDAMHYFKENLGRYPFPPTRDLELEI